MMYVGATKKDITPTSAVWMDGMIRSRKSEGVHDSICVRAVVLSNTDSLSEACAVVSVDACALRREDLLTLRKEIEKDTGISAERILVAATHTHSGPAVYGFFNPREAEYTEHLMNQIREAVVEAATTIQPAVLSIGHGSENSISHYRRFMDDDGRVVMIWEANPDERPMRVLGEADPSLTVLKAVAADNPNVTIAVLFNHAGHPNVMSGDNYEISADYPGVASRSLEESLGGIALFLNGAQGTVDIDNWKYRDWDGVGTLGEALAEAARNTRGSSATSSENMRTGSTSYSLPARKISDSEIDWADKITEQSGGKISAVADGVGDDFKALLYKELRSVEDTEIPVDQFCFVVGDTAFVSFPGELFSEIAAEIMAKSPFRNTCSIGLGNGYIGYVPTREAISQGGYEVDTRRVDDSAAEIIVVQTVRLLNEVFTK